MTEFIIAESGIRQLHARFSDAVFRRDAEAFVQCFADDGEWKLAAMHMRGREEIHRTFGLLLGATEKVHLILGLPILEVTGSTAIGRISCTEFTKMPDGSSALAVGIYYDRYIEVDGRWLFQWRHFGLQYRGPMDMSADMVESPDYGPFPGMPEADEPTITRRPESS